MKIFSEMIVLYDDIEIPKEDFFLPSFWAAEDFDSDGDFYWNEMEKDWTNLNLTKRYPNENDSIFELNIYREKFRKFEPSIQEVADLSRFITYKSEGRYIHLKEIAHTKNLCVASFSIDTRAVNDYTEFLQTIYHFLKYTNGVAISAYAFNADKFKQEFLE